jgi:hypothetical protein
LVDVALRKIGRTDAFAFGTRAALIIAALLLAALRRRSPGACTGKGP